MQLIINFKFPWPMFITDSFQIYVESPKIPWNVFTMRFNSVSVLRIKHIILIKPLQMIIYRVSFRQE